MKKKILSFILAATMSLTGITGAFAEGTASTAKTEETTSHSAGLEALDGKKVIFIGDSYVYYGRTVEADYALTQAARSDDKGGFYQLCKANGIDVSVTNWTFGSHGLSEIFDGVCTETTCSACTNGESHEDYLTDRNFDYVIVSPTRGADLETDFSYIMDFFRDANPDVKFVCLGSMGIHGINKVDTVYPDMLAYYKTLEKQGVIIADWGEMVKNIIDGDADVEGATQKYERSTFTVGDNYHPNLLTGYITTLFAYCAITGESALEQSYNYITDGSAWEVFDIASYVSSYYTNGEADTNFPKVLASESDMVGISKLVDEYLSPRGKELLDGKKVIFIGNSHIYRGLTVLGGSASVLTQEARSNDHGYFYQLCKANGIDVSVTNWTFGSHSLGSIFNGPCNISGECYGVNHEDYLTDREFDYVVFSPQSGNSEVNFVEDAKYIMDFFREANPDVKFICLGHASAYGCNATNKPYTHITGNYKTLDEMGVTIADWGDLVTGIIDGVYEVPNATEEYTKSSFIVSDGYHANALTGYITTLFAYCAITGESAVGQPYSFYNNTSLNGNFDIPSYVSTWYTNGASDTNFTAIFESESDMTGIQKLTDKVLSEKNYLNSRYATALPKDGVVLRMGLLGDTHITKEGTYADWSQKAISTLNRVGGMDVLALTGDVVWQDGTLTEVPYDILNGLLEEGNISNTTEGAIPYIYAVGNHEYLYGDNNKESCAEAAALFEKKMGQEMDCHKVYNGYHIITGAAYSHNFAWTDGSLNTNEEWIMDEIEAIEASEGYDPNEPIFLIMHYPIAGSVHRGISNFASKNTQEFIDFLSQRPNIVNISAHTHRGLQLPQTICQDLGFTAFQAPVTGDLTSVVKKQQLAFIDVTTDNKVKIYKIDLTTNEYIGEPWEIDIPAGADGFKYTDAVRADNTQTPVFDEDAKITFTEINNYSVKLTFPTGTVEAKNGQQDNYVRSHRITVTNKETGEMVKQLSFDADFVIVPQPQTLTREITELDMATDYIVTVEPMSMFGFYGEPITAEFTTAGNTYEEFLSEPITLTFDKTLVGETTDEEGTTSYDKLGSSNVLLRQGDYFTYTVNVGQGQIIEEAGLYKLTYNYGSKRNAVISSYVKWQGFDSYIAGDKSLTLEASGDYGKYAAGDGTVMLQLREGENTIKIAVNTLSNNDGIYMKAPSLRKVTSATYIDVPINNTVYNAATGANGTGTGSITSNIAKSSYQTESFLTFRQGDYVVVPVMVPATAAYEIDISAKSDKSLPASRFKLAYTTESLDAAAALTSYSNDSGDIEITAAWQMLGMGDAVVLEKGKIYYFKIAATKVGRSHISQLSNIRFTDNGEYGTNANLASISVDKGIFDKAFNKETLDYTVYADMPDSGKLLIEAEVEMDGSTVVGAGEVSVNYGINETIPVTVTSKNNKVVKTYNITFVIVPVSASLGCADAKMYVNGSATGIDVSTLFNGTGVVKNNGSSGAGFGVPYGSTAYIQLDLGAEYDLKSFTWERTNQGHSVKGITIWGSNDPEFKTYEALGSTYDTLTDGEKATATFTHKLMTTALNSNGSYRYVRINKPSGTGKDFYPVKIDLYGIKAISKTSDGVNEKINVPSGCYAVGDKVIAASYNGEGKMTGLKFTDAPNEAYTDLNLTKENANDTVKVMIWKDFEALQPRVK